MARRRQQLMIEIRNSELYHYYYERLINIALSQFIWNNLPYTCDRLYFEQMLLYRGSAAIYEPEGMSNDFWLSTGFLPIPLNQQRVYAKDATEYATIDEQIYYHNDWQPNGYSKYFESNTNFNVYGYPVNIVGIGYNGEQSATKRWRMLYDNMTRQALIGKIDLYARLLYEIHSTLRNNIRQQNTPYIIQSDRNKTFSIKQMFRSIFDFTPVLEMGSAFDKEEVDVLDLRVDYKADKLVQTLNDVWREALSMLGITTQQDKKERLLDNEIQVDQQADIISLNSRLLNRKEFCEKFNSEFGTNLSVEISSDVYNREREEALNGGLHINDSGDSDEGET